MSSRPHSAAVPASYVSFPTLKCRRGCSHGLPLQHWKNSKDTEEEFKKRAAQADESTRDFGAENWSDRLAKARAFANHDPTVLVVGGGQAGLSIAARLHQLGIDALIVDRHPRIGDNWRKRYHSLTLHNEVHVNHLPYLPFPPTFPVYIPKDKLANWFSPTSKRWS